MSDGATIALISMIGTLLVAALGWIVASVVRLTRRLHKLERRDRLSWLYIRVLINHIYVHKALPLPDPPAGWLDDPEE